MKYALIENNIVKIISYQPVEGWEEVADTVFADMVKQSDGTFINPPMSFESAMTDLRDRRNELLEQTDYLALSDQTMTTEMTTYRQALRDITNGLTTVEDVEAVVFPEKPEA